MARHRPPVVIPPISGMRAAFTNHIPGSMRVLVVALHPAIVTMSSAAVMMISHGDLE